jgi:hypothetical protein
MKLDKDTLIKQRFWVVLVACLPLVLLALIMLLTTVPAGIAQQLKAVKDKQAGFKVGDVKTPNWVDWATTVAEKYKKQETVVWDKSFGEQKFLMTWPEAFEAEFHFTDGLFANEVKVDLREAPKDAPKEEAPKEAEAPKLPDNQFQGKIEDLKGGTFTVRGPKNAQRKFYKTEKIKVVLEGGPGDNKREPGFEDLAKGQRVLVTFTRGKYFGEDMTNEERTKFQFTYKDQLREDFEQVDPLKPNGEGVMQFKDWHWKEDEPYPALPTEFFHYVKQPWDPPPTSEECWLAQEELWVQRELYRLIRSANDFVSQFKGERFQLTDKALAALRTEKFQVEPKAPPAEKGAEGDKAPPVEKAPEAEKAPTADKDKDKAADKIPPAVLTKLAGLKNKVYETRADFLKDLTKALGKGDLERYWEPVRRHAFLGQGGAGKDTYFTFTNPYWKLRLKLVRRSVKGEGDEEAKVQDGLEVQLTNLLQRRQNVDLRLRIRFTDKEEYEALKNPIGGEPLPPNGKDARGKPLPNTFTTFVPLEPGIKRTGVYGVEQVLTWDTAAVKRIDRISLGEPAAHSDRTFPKAFKAFSGFPEPKDGGAAKDPAGDPKAPGPAAAGPGAAAGGDARLSPNGLRYNRYSEETKQVRRMPVAVALVVDQDHLGLVQAAFADSKLRFQTTQVIMHRCPVSMRPPDVAEEPMGGNPPPKAGSFPPAAFKGGGGPRGEGGPRPKGPAFGPKGPAFGPKGPAPGPQMPGGMGFGAGASAGGDENEANIEVVIYGIVALYERFPPRAGATEPTKN